jgi:hypothetical protein
MINGIIDNSILSFKEKPRKIVFSRFSFIFGGNNTMLSP